MSRLLPRALVAAALAASVPAALAQAKPPAAPLGLDNLVAMCAGCHGIEGYKTAFPSVYHVPMIGGQQPQYIVNALKAYQSGERSHPSMRGIAGTLTEEQMQQLAEYYGGKK